LRKVQLLVFSLKTKPPEGGFYFLTNLKTRPVAQSICAEYFGSGCH
jgi:hypothetical protein